MMRVRFGEKDGSPFQTFDDKSNFELPIIDLSHLSVNEGYSSIQLRAEEEARVACEHSIKVAERYFLLNPDDALALSRVANDLVYLGDTEKGLRLAERAYSINPNVCRYNVACAFMAAGNTERALDLLEEHAKSGGVHVDWLEADSDWDAVRDLPRYKAILELAH